jgi:hypothetical protein
MAGSAAFSVRADRSAVSEALGVSSIVTYVTIFATVLSFTLFRWGGGAAAAQRRLTPGALPHGAASTLAPPPHACRWHPIKYILEGISAWLIVDENSAAKLAVAKHKELRSGVVRAPLPPPPGRRLRSPTMHSLAAAPHPTPRHPTPTTTTPQCTAAWPLTQTHATTPAASSCRGAVQEKGAAPAHGSSQRGQRVSGGAATSGAERECCPHFHPHLPAVPLLGFHCTRAPRGYADRSFVLSGFPACRLRAPPGGRPAAPGRSRPWRRRPPPPLLPPRFPAHGGLLVSACMQARNLKSLEFYDELDNLVSCWTRHLHPRAAAATVAGGRA